MLRMRTTPEGYTHDWEVFVRGVDNADIHNYIEKVVFLLHDTFRNPRRIIKEPPFVVKESGYAGFILPIEVYLKNKDEPKKFQISYDLHLQQSGPPINNAIRHTEIIRNPSDEFRKKLLKGGATVVSSRDGSLEKSDAKASTMVGKPKLNGSENKKHRIAESKTSNSFCDLFGPPIKTAPTKISPDSKKTSQSDKTSVPKPLAVTEKSDKVEKLVKTKESPHKDSRKDKVDEKKDKKIRESSKDQFKNKEKSKRPPSPGNKSHLSPGSKRPASPVATKKPPSPTPVMKRPLSPKPKEKEVKKIVEKEKDNKEKEKAKNNSKSELDSSKSEKKKDKKKHKDDRDKERKDKYKEAEKVTVKDVAKVLDKKSEKTDKMEKSDKDKSQEYKSSSRDGRKSPKPSKEIDKVKDEKAIKVEKSEKSEKSEKMKDGKNDKDRQKHKHKKHRDKKDKRDSKDRDKKEKRDRSKEKSNIPLHMSSASGGNSLSLLTENPERDSSDSAPSVDDDSLSESKPTISMKKETEHAVMSITTAETAKPLSPGISMEVKKDKSDRSRRDKSKGSKNEERENRKRKKSKEDEEPRSVKREKGRGHSTSPPLEPVSSSQSPVAIDIDSIHHSEKDAKKDFKKDKENRVDLMDVVNDKDVETDAEQVAPDSTNSTDAEISEPPPLLSEDYVSQLKELQQKIMTLQDNQELQRVVQVIAETGQYEITKKTFDFDLCALDRRTVQRLQQFFSAS